MTQDENLDHSKPLGPTATAQGSGRRPDPWKILAVLVGMILLGWTLRAMAVVVVPLVAAILIALAVMPVRDWVRDRVPGRMGWLGHVTAMTLILLVLCLFFGGLWFAAQQVLSQFPVQPDQIATALQEEGGETDQDSLAESAAAGAAAESGTPAGRAASGGGAGQAGAPDGLLSTSVEGILRMLGDRVAGAAGGVAVTILNSAMATLAGLVLIFFLTLLILIESADWQRKVQTIMPPRTEWRLSESAEVIAGKVRTYLVLRAGLGLATAALYAGWLWFFDVGLIFVWALLTFLLSFVPVIGSLVAGLLPVAYALLTHDWGTALIIGAGILVIEQVMGSYVDPRLEGDHIALSPLVVLLALLFWGWIWGIAGALLAVPVTVSLVVLGAHLPGARPWALMLTDRTTWRGLDEVTRPE